MKQFLADYFEWLKHLDQHIAAWCDNWVAQWRENHTSEGVEAKIEEMFWTGVFDTEHYDFGTFRNPRASGSDTVMVRFNPKED